MSIAKVPHSIDAERTLLGQVLVNPVILPQLEESLAADDFYRAAHLAIYRAMVALSARGVAVDLVTVKDELARAGQLDMVGGAEYLAGLTDGMPRVTHVEAWLKIVRDKAIQRSLISAANAIAAHGYDGADDAKDLVDLSMSELMRVADRAHGASGFVSPQLSAKAAMVWLDQMMVSTRGIVGLATGLTEFDERVGGMKPGNLIIIGARPGMGKSAWAVTVADNIAALGGKVAYFSLEMSHEELTLRRLAKRSRVSAGMLKFGGSDFKDVAAIYADVANSPLYIDDTADLTAQQIRAKARRMKVEKGLDLVIVDYLQLVSGERRYSANREQEVSGVSRALKQLAKELAVPVIALCQLSRRCEERTDKRPVLSDLRESGGIENDADMVAFLYRPVVYDPSSDPGIAEFICRKHRNGGNFQHTLIFESEITTFRDNLTQSRAT